MPKSADAFRTIREVSEWLETPAHVLRFWESKFRQVAPVKRAGGRRYYRPADMLLLGGLKKLLHEDDMSIKDAVRFLKSDGVKAVQALSRPLDTDVSGHAIVDSARKADALEAGNPMPDVQINATAIPEMPVGSVLQDSTPVLRPDTASETDPQEASTAPAPKAPVAEPDLFSLMEPASGDASAPELATKSATDHVAETVEPSDLSVTDALGDAIPSASVTSEIAKAEIPEPAATPVVPTPVLSETTVEPPPVEATFEAARPAPKMKEITTTAAIETIPVPDDPTEDDILTDDQPVLASILETSFPELVAAAPALEVAATRLETLRNRMASR